MLQGTLPLHCSDLVIYDRIHRTLQCTLPLHCSDLVIFDQIIFYSSLKYTFRTLPEHCSVPAVYTTDTFRTLPEHCSVPAVYTTDCRVHCKVQCTLHITTTLEHCIYTAGGTLHIHFSLCSVAAAYTAQSMQLACSLHCLYTAGTLHFGLGTSHNFLTPSLPLLMRQFTFC